MTPSDDRPSPPEISRLRYLDVMRGTPDPLFIFPLDAGHPDAVPAPLYLNPAAARLLEEAGSTPAAGETAPSGPLAAPLRRILRETRSTMAAPSPDPRMLRVELADRTGTLRRLRLRCRVASGYLLLRMVDETELLEGEVRMRRRTELLRAVSQVATIFLSGPWRVGFDRAARVLGEAAGVSRVYHFERIMEPRGSRVFRQTHEWCAPGVRSELGNPDLQQLDLDVLGAGPLAGSLGNGEPWATAVDQVDDPVLRALLESQDIRAVACFPYLVDGVWRGYIGMDDCVEVREWSEGEMEVLQTAAVLLGSAMGREAEQAQLRDGQRLDSVGRLAGGMAHDFNNLLTVIRANLELALLDVKEEDAESELRAGIEAALDASGRGARLIQQLLAFARRQIVQPRPVEVDALVGDFAQLLRRVLGDTIEIEVEAAYAEGSVVLMDPGQLEQVLMNLALNARDAMPSGGTLTLTVEREGHDVRLRVADTGTGMPPGVVAQLFEPFFTTKPPGRGVGLGLSTVYGIVKQAGGEITVDSEPGKGTRFNIRLPLAPEPDA